MRLLAAALFFLAQPFWDAKPPEKWSESELQKILTDSPWAQSVGPSPNATVVLATAGPIEDAEAEARVRSKPPLPDADPDYLDYLREHREESVVLSIPYRSGAALSLEEERRMDERCLMTVGKRTHKLVGHFPPTESDPVLRLVFPRDGGAEDKSVVFRLYLPEWQFPEREVEFRVKEMVYHGKLAM